jgi:hypothetical protein
MTFFVEDNKMKVWTLSDREIQLYIVVDNKDADRSVDSPRWREPIIHHQREEHA